ncbi:hypothetical protein [Endozoicomonas sp. ALC013]
MGSTKKKATNRKSSAFDMARMVAPNGSEHLKPGSLSVQRINFSKNST